MFFVSLKRPTEAQEQAVCEKGSSLGFNFKSAGSTKGAPPLLLKAQQDGWWNIDHERIKVGYGKDTYMATKELLNNWGQFQLPWAQVRHDTPTKPGTYVCVTANILGLWTAVPLQTVYKQEGKWHRQIDTQQRPLAASKSTRHHGQQLSYANACLKTHFLAGEERFKVEWDQTDGSVWYDIYTVSRPDHPLAFFGYPVVRWMQQRFRHDSMRAVARAAAVHTVDTSMDEKTKRRIERFEVGLLDKFEK